MQENMSYRNPFVIAIGKGVQRLARLRGGGGSAAPGLVVDKIAPDFAPRVLGSLPFGVVVISGTNGKTTTTKIVTELLESQGLRVLTNDSGSNFMRGVIAALLTKITWGGRLDADIAVLELDEAHAVHFTKRVPPRYTLLLNVMPDQLDRFGSVEYTAGLLKQVAHNTTDKVIVNREDSLLAALGDAEELSSLSAQLRWFGLSDQLRGSFSRDGEEVARSYDAKRSHEAAHGQEAGRESRTASVVLRAMEGNRATFEFDGSVLSAELMLKGLFNALNAAAALALVAEVLGKDDPQRNRQLIDALAKVQSAFGRGESFVVKGHKIELLLVKNAGGFRLALDSFDSHGHTIMVAINDEFGDGRDVSWLFDVDFASLREADAIVVSGTRAYDMALRLGYDEISWQQIEADPLAALDKLLSGEAKDSTPVRIYCTYTAMMKLRPYLEAQPDAKRVVG